MPCDVHRRLTIPVQPVPKQDPRLRVDNWEEVFLGYDLKSAMVEAERCIHCPDTPCTEACPVQNDIPGAFLLLEKGDVIGAASKFRQTSDLPEMCGRLCPQEVLCEGACPVGFAIRPADGIGGQPPVSIGKLEAFVSDYQRKTTGFPVPELPPPTGRRVAVIGSGPAGLAAAEELRKQGHDITVFDAWPQPGGILRYGIPNFKMGKQILEDKLDFLQGLGVTFVCNAWVGRDVSIDELFVQGYDAVFIGTGAPVGSKLGIPGADLKGILMATEFLVRGNLPAEALPEDMQGRPEVGEHLVVIGGGDTSMDCVRTAVRLGADKVTCVYRRTESEQKGREEERHHAREENVQFLYLTVPLRFIGEDGHITAIECQKMQLGEPDESGRRRPLPVPGSQFVIPADTAVVAIGYVADTVIEETTRG
ncbi:MAG: NAD(P)-dependent oxidoreductase, partial [Dehalococcoidia bacterium]